MKGKIKELPPPPAVGFSSTSQCVLPVWDDHQIAQEDWGAPLAASNTSGVGHSGVAATLAALGVTSGAAPSTKEGGKGGKPGKESASGGAGSGGGTGDAGPGFCDTEGRAILQKFVEWGLSSAAKKDRPNEETKEQVTAAAVETTAAGDEGAAVAGTPTDVARETSPKPKKPAAAAPPLPPVKWQRPVEIVKPFRPIVHRNATPFLNPYSTEEEALQPFDAKLEEARYREDATTATGAGATAGAAAGATGSAGAQRGGAAARGKAGRQSQVQVTHGGKEVAGAAAFGSGPWHQRYPETVSVLEDLVGQDVSSWMGLHREEAIARYRELPALMGPYNPHLVAGCAETPAEACQARYSTALRHKLQQVQALEALESIPPFLMSAFNSALLVVEQSQHLVSPGNYLWELIYPHAPGTCHPVYNPHGKYAVKLFVDGAYRKVLVDDALPVDQLGRPILSVTARKELWPAILAKAVFKALGAASQRSLTVDPDTVISCLMGDWVPQYFKPKRAPVATAALLMTYQLHLDTQRARREHARTTVAVPPALVVKSEVAEDNKAEEAAAPAVTGGVEANSRGSVAKLGGRNAAAQRKPKVKEVVEVQESGEKLFAEEYCPPSDDEPLEKRPFLVCGLRTRCMAPDGAYYDGQPDNASGKGSTYAQLYAVTDIASFRNTIAIRITTTPRCDLTAGIFDRERSSQDVQDVLSRESTLSLQHTLASVEKASSVGNVWLTFEEFSGSLDGIVVWRNFDHRYLHSTILDTTNTTITQIGPGPSSPPLAVPAAASTSVGAVGGKANAGANAANNAANNTANTGPAAPSLMDAVTWVSITSDAPEEVAIVIASPPLFPPGNDDGADNAPGGNLAALAASTAAAGAEAGGKAAKGNATAPAKPAPKAGKKKDDKADAQRSLQAQQLAAATEAATKAAAGGEGSGAPSDEMVGSPMTFASPVHGGSHTLTKSAQDPVASAGAVEKKRIQVEHYVWDRAYSLAPAFDVVYENGKVTSHLFRLRPGTHIFKLSIPEMYSNDKVSLYCNARMTVRGGLLELLKDKRDTEAALFHIVSDAGVHPAVERAEDEMVWFKRCLNVSTETTLTLVLSTLLPGDDVAAHRFAAPAAAHTFSGLLGGAIAVPVKGGGGGGGAKGANTAGPKAAGQASNAAATGGGGASSGGGVGGGASGRHGGGGHAGKDSDELDHRDCTISILKYTSLLLVDLDKFSQQSVAQPSRESEDSAKAGKGAREVAGSAVGGLSAARSSSKTGCADTASLLVAEASANREASLPTTPETAVAPPSSFGLSSILVGHAGRLPMITLRPNRRGYLLMAYTSVPASDAETVRASFCSGGAQSQQTPGDGDGNASCAANTRPEETASKPSCEALYGKGLWKLAIRSNQCLQQFDSIPSHQQVVPISGSLRRGGAAVTSLFRYAITVTEPTHLSLLLNVRESMPIPLDLVIKRCPPPGSSSTHGTSATPAVAATVSASQLEDGNGDGESSGMTTGTEEVTVFATETFRVHAFVPDVLLAPVAPPPVSVVTGATKPDKTAGGGGSSNASHGLSNATTFIVEASVPTEAAEEWDELCRQTQEDAFHERNNEVISAVAEKHAADMAELANDKAAFIARKMEELEQQEAREGCSNAAGGASAESAANAKEPSTLHNGSGGGPNGPSGASNRRRRSGEKKKGMGAAAAGPSSTSPAAAAAAAGRATPNVLPPSSSGDAAFGGVGGSGEYTGSGAEGGQGAAAAKGAVVPVDSTPEDLAVTFHGTFFLSNAKADVRNATPAEDLVAKLRSMWKNYSFDSSFGAAAALDTADTSSAPPAVAAGSGVNGAAAGGGAGASSKAAKALLAAAQQQQQQKENEELQRGARGRRSRQAFLANPMNVLEPHFLAPRAPDAGGLPLSRDALSASRGRGGNNPAGNAVNAGPAKDAASSGGGGGAKRDHAKGNGGLDTRDSSTNGSVPGHCLVYEDTEENNFSHMPPLAPSEYSVKLLPLRSVEVSLPEAPEQDVSQQQQQQRPLLSGDRQGKGERDGVHSGPSKRGAGAAGLRTHSAAGNSGGTASGSRAAGAAGQQQQREKDRAATNGGGSSSLAAIGASATSGASAALFAELLQKEEQQRVKEAFWTLVREPLARYTVGVMETAQAERDCLRDNRLHSAKLMAAFWEEHAEGKRAAAEAAAAATEAAVEAAPVEVESPEEALTS